MLATLVAPASAASADTTTVLEAATNVGASVAFSQATFADGAAPTVLLARDDDFADTLTSSSVQGTLDAPLLLTDPQALSPDTTAELQRLDPELVYIMGGETAVTPAVQAAVEAMDTEVRRFAGATRVETAVEVARQVFPEAATSVVARAFPDEDPTRAFADPIAAGAYSAASDTPVLLTMPDDLPDATRDYLEESSVESAIVAGGLEAVEEPVEQELVSIDISGQFPSDADPADVHGFTTTRAAGATRGGTAVELARQLGYQTAADAPRVVLVPSFGADAWASGLTVGAQTGNGAALMLSLDDGLWAETETFLAPAEGGVPLICAPLVADSACAAASSLLGPGDDPMAG